MMNGVDIALAAHRHESDEPDTTPPVRRTPSVLPPRMWTEPTAHFKAALTDPWYNLITRLMGDFCFSTHDFFRQRGMLPVLLPITCGSISSPMGLGSDSLPVQIDLFGEKTYLADSMQFLLEYALRQCPEGVFYIMPTFRGEEPDERHLNQFFHSEAEIVGNLPDVMDLVERYVLFCTQSILSRLGNKVDEQVGTVDHLRRMVERTRPFPRITFEEARKTLGSDPRFYSEPHPGVVTLSRKGEAQLIKEAGDIVWLTHMPALTVPFYQALDTDGDHALCADLLFGIGEVVGCGQRCADGDQVRASLARHTVDPAEYDWYLRMKTHYPLQTAGFGLGLERFLLWVLQHDDIRDIHMVNRLKGINSSP